MGGVEDYAWEELRTVCGRHIGQRDVVVADAAQARQDLQRFSSILEIQGGRCYLGEGGDNEVLAVPEGGEGELFEAKVMQLHRGLRAF